MVPKEGSEKPKLLNLVNDPQRSEAEYKTSKRLTFATRRSIRKLEIGGNSSSSTTIETTSTIKMKGYHLETPEISFDESVTGKIKFWKDAPHMLLYVDDYTVMEEVTDLTQLRKGDHCIVGLNPVRKVGKRSFCYLFYLSCLYLFVLSGKLMDTLVLAVRMLRRPCIQIGKLGDSPPLSPLHYVRQCYLHKRRWRSHE